MPQDFLGDLELRVRMVPQVPLAFLELQAHVELQDCLEHLARLVILDHQELQDPLVLLVLLEA